MVSLSAINFTYFFSKYVRSKLIFRIIQSPDTFYIFQTLSGSFNHPDTFYIIGTLPRHLVENMDTFYIILLSFYCSFADGPPPPSRYSLPL